MNSFYKGIEIEKVGDYYYPKVNADIESKNIEDIKIWIDSCFIPAKNSLKKLGINIQSLENLKQCTMKLSLTVTKAL